ncbi:MAG TPA: DUF2845 domain-containing protein [Polyangiaceae bacterium]|nr:DUF2845 domain-containing protein [Polyangiaceae bacterium]
MSERYLSVWAAGLVCALFSPRAAADSLRCGDRLASTGDSTYEVQSICGEPDAAVHRVEYRTVRIRVPAPCHDEHGCRRCDAEVERTVEVVVDDWTYDFGRNRFVEYVGFENGRLVSIREGSYGHKD